MVTSDHKRNYFFRYHIYITLLVVFYKFEHANYGGHIVHKAVYWQVRARGKGTCIHMSFSPIRTTIHTRYQHVSGHQEERRSRRLQPV